MRICVAAATGPVGATIGQNGKLMGCQVVGVAGGPEKCGFAVDTLAFGACLDHKSAEFAARLKAATPRGIHVYFENGGGTVFDTVLAHLNTGACVPVGGAGSQYNATHMPAGRITCSGS